jgi:hypothetical protein
MASPSTTNKVLPAHSVESENCPGEPSGLKVDTHRLVRTGPESRANRLENPHVYGVTVEENVRPGERSGVVTRRSKVCTTTGRRR